MFVWAYEKSTQEYLAIKQDLAEPDQLRLQYREMIKQCIHDTVVNPDLDSIYFIEKYVKDNIEETDRENVKAL